MGRGRDRVARAEELEDADGRRRSCMRGLIRCTVSEEKGEEDEGKVLRKCQLGRWGRLPPSISKAVHIREATCFQATVMMSLKVRVAFCLKML